jgi:hypothetical protein
MQAMNYYSLHENILHILKLEIIVKESENCTTIEFWFVYL